VGDEVAAREPALADVVDQVTQHLFVHGLSLGYRA
jgi:hypothetical protein